MSAIAFTTPLLLLGLLLLPILWWLLRAVPPAPIRRRFSGIILLLGLKDDESQTSTTPWWLLLLRMLAVAAAIIAFAGPVLNPREAGTGRGPLLVLMDASWASARDWPQRMERVEGLLRDAARAGRVAAVLSLTDELPDEIPFQGAQAWIERLPSVQPRAWEPDYSGLSSLDLEGAEVVWFSDGLEREGRGEIGAHFVAGSRPIIGLTPPRYEEGAIRLHVVRLGDAGTRTVALRAIGPGPTGAMAELGTGEAVFEEASDRAEAELRLPPELRNRVSRIEIAGERTAGAVALADDSLARREVALLATAGGESEDLLDPLFYLRRALAPTADLIEGDLDTILPANPDVLVFADVARLSPSEALRVEEWVEGGGLLLRFAGPRLAASDVSRADEDPLMPVRLRSGGRTVGGALSWGEPKLLRPFPDESPFAGLDLPQEVTVTSQVVAQPDPTLAERAIAALADGTPLVTRKSLGEGQVVLFHVTANAEWSNLPISGLFVQMLERLAVSTRPAAIEAEELEGTTWTPRIVLDGFGRVRDAGTLPGVAGEDLADGIPTADLPPGVYEGPGRSLALNVLGPEAELVPASYPAGATVEALAIQEETDLAPWLLAVALILLAMDAIATLWLGGRLRGAVAVLATPFVLVLPDAASAGSTCSTQWHCGGAISSHVQGMILLVLIVMTALAAIPILRRFGAAALIALSAMPASAQDDPFPTDVSLAYVQTGNPRIDDVSEAGMRGLSRILTQRTSVEPEAPRGVNLETDELAFLPFLYWPVTEDQPLPSQDAYAKLNRYLRGGGMIVFDTRDADLGGFGSNSPASRRLRDLAAPLDIPPLEPLPGDHVLTRSFYLLQDFPGRFASRDVWVEASPAAEQVEGMPFRNLNDGVTPVLIGGNDWAAAWATDQGGRPLLPVGSGYSGEQQREIAYRFGVNLVMHVLSGNYKSDQVHVPALLDRLGN
ncbi:DUF4159 domain-containing protein [Jannaschia aquimarina]|uniref:Aerotolerance regulator N-terminal domain-containing protein n=1 Tax=Jannaschia aquimarina TaxID=935700 RepID=A0A0D1EJ70_9RHOB|nr:DUF4159 domain-containing protein [Jannaschia aquimarina]KIT17026.1 hypothetical protein jaqu_12160 [Jannaschia aquimarina]SNS81745.1 N-terminal double-transmembrane domain-containing protein [Jannaschia aquimarina]